MPTATLANLTNAVTGSGTVRTNGGFTLPRLASNALLTNAANGIIGYKAFAMRKEVLIVHPAARRVFGAALFAGIDGASIRFSRTGIQREFRPSA